MAQICGCDHVEYIGDYNESIYLRSRYYLPGTGRFLNKDTWHGNPSQPLTLNYWNYVNGNPINYADPSGYSPNCANAGTCGPDVTNWFKDEMSNQYYYGLEIRAKVLRMKALAVTVTMLTPCTDVATFLSLVALEAPFNQIVREFNFPKTNVPIGVTPLMTPMLAMKIIDVLALVEYGAYGLAVDYANVNYNNSGASCSSMTGSCAFVVNPEDSKSHQVISLCDQCRDASDLGNMMFGLGGAARGYSWSTTLAAALTYNALADDPKSAAQLIQATIGSPDGYAALPGYVVAASHSFYFRSTFCAVANVPIGWDNLDKISGCQSCGVAFNADHKIPSSINRVSGFLGPGNAPNTVVELQNKVDNLFEKLLEYLP